MRHDPLWQQIETAMTKRLDPATFERCAQDLLRRVYPTLVPVVGGSDAGMDGAIASVNGGIPLICTSGEDVLDNCRRSVANHLRRRGGPARCVIATSEALTPQRRDNILDEARSQGVVVEQIHDRHDFIGRLYHDARWRLELLGITGTPPALSVFPPFVRESEPSLLIGREEDLGWLRVAQRDALLVGQPGSGKTHLHQHLALSESVLFAVTDDETRLANAIREQRPSVIVVDDAHVRLHWIDSLRRLRAELGAAYHVHANCWPTYSDQVRDRLALPASGVRELRPLPRKQMHELILALGIHGPDALFFLLIEQAAGRPGLCAALVDACKRGEMDQLWTGDALADRLLIRGSLLRDEVDRELLARFALGGDAGTSVDAVVASMEIRRSELRDRIAALGAGGIVAEISGDRLLVLPEPLRAVLVRDVFFVGPARPSLDRALADCPDAAAVTHVLLAAGQRGADVSRELLRARVIAANDNALWEHYAFIDHRAAADVLERDVATICQAGNGLLHHKPDEALEALVRASDANAVPRSGDTHHPHRLIQEWVSEWDLEHETVPRRRSLLLALERTQCSSQTLRPETLLTYLGLILDPNLHGMKQSPADRNTFTHRRGMHCEESIRGIADVWPRVLALLPTKQIAGWRSFLERVDDWVWPGRGSVPGTPTSQVTFMKEAGTGFIRELSMLPQCGRALRKQLRWIDRSASLGLAIPRDDPFDAVLGERFHGEDWDEAQARRTTELETLRDQFLRAGCHEAAKTLGEIEREFTAFYDTRDGWDRVRLYAMIAAKAIDPADWLKALIDERILPTLLAPFIEPVRLKSPARWEVTIRQLLCNPNYAEVGRQSILNADSTPEDLVDQVLSTVEPLDDNNAFRFSYATIPVDRMLRLLGHADPQVRLGAAIGEWYGRPDHLVRAELLDAWKRVIVDAEPPRNVGFSELLKSDVDVATEWARRRIESGGHGVWRFDHVLAQIAVCLDRNARRQMAANMNSRDRYDDGVFDALVPDSEAFEAWLDDVTDNETRVLPLRRAPSTVWEARTILALDAGVPVELIAEGIGTWGESWSGPASEHFGTYVEAYERLIEHLDPRIRPIATRGREWAALHVAEAKRREQLEAMR